MRVFWDGAVVATTDENGYYVLDVPDRNAIAAIAWVTVPDGFRPGAVWRQVPTAGDASADFALVPTEETGPLSFVVAADLHIGKGELGGARSTGRTWSWWRRRRSRG